MSGGITATTVLAAAAAAGTAYSIYAGERAASQQEDALNAQKEGQAKALEQSKKNAQDQQIAMNRANRKQPDVAAVMAQAGADAKGGPSGTMLTGPQGVDPSALSLGKSTLLGG